MSKPGAGTALVVSQSGEGDNPRRAFRPPFQEVWEGQMADETQEKVDNRKARGKAHQLPANWYERVPLSAQMFMQFGFAGLMAVVFIVQFQQNAQENREARTMYRDDMAAMRGEISKATSATDARTDRVIEQVGQLVHRIDRVGDKMTDVSFQLQRTTDALRAAGVQIKKAADMLEDGQGIAPPREKVTGPGGSP